MLFKCATFLCLILILFNSVDSVSRRQKRHVVFPEGSSFSLAICMTTLVITPFHIISEGINWGITWDLPNNTQVLRLSNSKYFHQRRNRRDLYKKVESIMDNMGYAGRSCIFRALCEAGKRYGMTSRSENEPKVMEDVFRAVFQFPERRMTATEPDEHRLYHWAYRVALYEPHRECWELYPDCSLSLFDMFVGKLLQK